MYIGPVVSEHKLIFQKASFGETHSGYVVLAAKPWSKSVLMSLRSSSTLGAFSTIAWFETSLPCSHFVGVCLSSHFDLYFQVSEKRMECCSETINHAQDGHGMCAMCLLACWFEHLSCTQSRWLLTVLLISLEKEWAWPRSFDTMSRVQSIPFQKNTACISKRKIPA